MPAWLSGVSSNASPIASSRAPSQSTRLSRRGEVSAGMLATSETSTTAPAAADTQNSAGTPPIVDSTPASGMPAPPPTPSIAPMSATALPRPSGGTARVTRAMPRGMAATATPCTARPASSGPMEVAVAHSTEPATNAPMATSSIRRGPSRSPSRPRSGLAIAPVTSVAVTSQLASAPETPSCSRIWGSTGTTMAWGSAATRAAAATARTTGRDGSPRPDRLATSRWSRRRIVVPVVDRAPPQTRRSRPSSRDRRSCGREPVATL